MKTNTTSRTRTSARILAGSIAALLAAQSAFAQNTVNNYPGAPTGSLLVTGNWSLGASPLVTNDAVFPLGAGGGIRTLSAGDLTVGSFNVLANTNTFSIRNDTSGATNRNLTLGGVGNLGNSVSGTAADLFYVASGSTFNIIGANGGGGTGVLNLILGQSGNFNLAGTAASTVSAVISDGTSPNALTKTGTGTLTLSSNNTYTGATTVNAGTLKSGVVSVANVSGAFGNNSAVTLANVAGATLNITGFNTQIGSLTGGGAAGGNVTLGAATLTVGGDNTSPAAYVGIMSGTGGLTKIGTGTLTLSGANTYSGTTTVSAGTLLANNTTGSGTGGNSVIVGAAGTLGGTGTITGVVTVDGMLSPGNSIESLATGTVNLNTGSTLDYEASPVDANYADLLDITGNLNLSGTVALDLVGADLANPAWGLVTISIASYTGTWNGGTFASWLDDTAQSFGGNSWTINYNDIVAGINFTSEQPAPGTQNFVTLTQTVPEPSALLSLLGGSALLLLRRRRAAV